MKTSKLVGLTFLLTSLLSTAPALAASNPALGQAGSFTVLSGTYSNTASGTVISNDLGYTTPPAVSPTVNGTTHVADAVYNQAGIDQGSALSSLNAQPCSYTFPIGVVDLASDTTHGTVGVYAPGVYCITGAAAVGGGGTITLTGAGTYIFRMTGALTSTSNSIIAVAGGASACNVWWTPGAATTLGANSTFGGTVIDASGITIGNTVVWTGRALAFGGTVSTTTDTVNSSSCPSTVTSATSTQATATKTPTLPNTGGSPLPSTSTNMYIAPVVIVSALSLAYYFRKRTV